ncbi:MAG: MFS transporter [Chloroflexi bacterium]|nr:MFS transporter [Chloroflexota bacterium]
MLVPRAAFAAPRVYLILRGGFALFFSLITTVNLVYQAEVAGLNPLQLVLVGTLLETVTFLCEIPTGVVADVFSRRLSVIIGHALIGVGFLLEGAFPFFVTILLAQVVWGAGWTFISGAREAWIADEVGEAHTGPLYLRGAQASQIGTLAGIPVSIGLASVQLNLPILAGGALFVALALFLVIVMPEQGFRPTPRGERSSWQAMGQTFWDGTQLVRQRPVLLTILGIGAFSGMASEGFDRLWTPHLLGAFSFPDLGGAPPIVWFGVLRGVAALLALAVTEVIRRRLDLTGHRRAGQALLIADVLVMGSMIVFGVAGNFLVAIAAFWSITMLRRTREPLWFAWINQHIDAKVRATVLSMSSQADAFGQIMGGPLLGLLAVGVSLPAALVAAGLALAPALPLYLVAIRRGAPKEAAAE